MQPINRALWVINLAHGLRTMGTSFMAIIFPLFAARLGLHALGLGLFIGVAVLFGSIYTALFTRLAPKHGIGPLLFISSIMMVISGLIYVNSHSLLELFPVTLLGYVPPNSGLFANSLEEGLLAHTPATQRTRIYSIYGMVGTGAGALGALSAAAPHSLGFSTYQGERILFWTYLTLGLIVSILSSLLIVRYRPYLTALGPTPPSTIKEVRSDKSRKLIYRLAGLFVADSMGSGMVTTPLIVYWLHVRFHMSMTHLAILFFGIDLMAAVSFPLAARIARYIGLLNTAVFTHIPSSILWVSGFCD